MTAIKAAQSQSEQPSTAQAPDLSAAMSPAVAQRAVLLETLRHLLANIPGVQASDDAEFVHQARVALRRLRAAQKAFAAAEPDVSTNVESRLLDTELRWLSAALGNVRDLDVLLGQTLPPVVTVLAPDINFAALQRTLQQQRNSALRKLRAALHSARYTKLLQHLQHWLDTQPPAGAIALREFAQQALQRRWRRVRKLLRKLAALDRTERHTLRKRTKELRYALEFFAPLFRQKRGQRYLRALQALQQSLGAINDCAAAQRLLEQLIQAHPQHAYCGGIAIGWVAAMAAQAESELELAANKLRKQKIFW